MRGNVIVHARNKMQLNLSHAWFQGVVEWRSSHRVVGDLPPKQNPPTFAVIEGRREPFRHLRGGNSWKRHARLTFSCIFYARIFETSKHRYR